jgi:hypothetical protein
MKSRWQRSRVAPVLGLAAVFAVLVLSVSATGHPFTYQEAGPPPGAGQGRGEDQRMPLFGKISAVHSDSFEITNANGDNVVVKLTDKTEFRKDREPAKRTDFKIGDIIIVRGEENADQTWTAQVVGARSMNGGPGGRGEGAGRRGGPGGPGGGGFVPTGTLGKDFVTGEVKSIDAPKLSVLRSDNVTQTIELNEETSLRKGRDAITMADIQVGDHVFARGALENNVFVPHNVLIIGPEQWKRMQEFAQQAGAGGQRPARPDSNPAPQSQKPTELQR